MKMDYADTAFYIEFDSGNNKPLNLPDSLFMRSEDYKNGHYALSNGVVGYSLYSKNTSHSYRTVSNVTLGGHLFTDVVLDAQPSTQMLIGTPFIRDRETILDWEHHKIYFTSLPETGKGEDSRHSMGLSFSEEEDSIKVDHLWKGSAADKAGIQIGDEVISINGQDTRSIKHEAYCSLRNALYEPEVQTTVRHVSGAERQAETCHACHPFRSSLAESLKP